MITKKPLLMSTLLLVALLVPSVAQPMKRLRDDKLDQSDPNERPVKQQKVNDVMIRLASEDNQVVEISKSAAIHYSVTLKDMIADFGQDADFSEISFPMPNMSFATVKQVVACLNVIQSGGEVTNSLTTYVQALTPRELEALSIAANYLDIQVLLNICQKSKIKPRSSGPIKLSWPAAGQDQWIEVPRNIAQHSGTVQDIMSYSDDLIQLSVSQEALEHIVDCLKIIDDNKNQNDQLKSLDENIKTKSLAFSHLDTKLWNKLFVNMEHIKTENKSHLAVALANYIKNMSHKELCHLMNAANYLDIVPLLDVCIKKCIEFCSSEQALNDFKELVYVEEFPSFELSNQCALQLSYFPETKDWLTDMVQPITLLYNDGVESVCFSPCKILALCFNPRKIFASESDDKSIKLLQKITDDESCMETLSGHDACINVICFNPDGTILASGSKDETIKLWKEVNGNWICIATLNGHTRPVTSICFSPDGKILASGALDNTIRLWNVVTGECINIIKGHMHCVTSISFSSDGKILASGSDDKTIKLWKEDDGIWSCFKTLNEHNAYVTSICFSPDGTTLASGSGDHTIKLWKKVNEKWACIDTLDGHFLSVNSVSFSPDGKILASGSSDKTIKLWKKVNEKWACIDTLDGHRWGVNSVSFSPDGKILASGSNEKTIKLWNVIKIPAIQEFFACITLEQAMFLKLVLQAHTTCAFDLTKENHKHLLEIFQALPEELRELLLEKQFVRVPEISLQ